MYKMKFKLGQRVKYKKVVRKIPLYINKEAFYDEEIVRKDKIKMAKLTKERYGFIIGTRNIAKKAKYTFNDNDPDTEGFIVHEETETIIVYKVAYDMAHTNFVLEEDLYV